MAAKEKLEIPADISDIYEIGPTGIPRFKLFVGGRWRWSSSGDFFQIRSPSTRNVIADVAKGTRDDVLDAIAAAVSTKDTIRSIAAIERIGFLQTARDLILTYSECIINLMMMEGGKTRDGAQGEIHAATERMRLTIEEAKQIYGEFIPGDWVEDTRNKIALIIREPVGVVAAITPFNYPLFSPIAKIAPALISGNAIVHKPATDAPITSLILARLLQIAGIPNGAINVVPGPGGDVGDTLIGNERVNAVSFTGSTSVGLTIPCKAGMKKLHLELGGKAAAIVLEDADLDLAAEKITTGTIRNSGQRCDAISRALPHKAIADELARKLAARFQAIKAGSPWDADTEVGPLINERALEKVDGLVKDALQRGASLLAGGGHRELVYEPTLLDNVSLDARITWEEIFGPVLPIIRVKDDEEAIEIANRSEYGLDSAIFTNSLYRMWKIAKALQVGTVTVNDLPTHGVGNFPFGGQKRSGLGREGLRYSIDELTVIKTISINLEPAGMSKKIGIKRS